MRGRKALGPRGRRKILGLILGLLVVMGCAHLSTLPLNGRWDVDGAGEVRIGFGIMSIHDPDVSPFPDAGRTTTYIPLLAWTWNDRVHVVPAAYALETGYLGGPVSTPAPLLPLRHNMPAGRLNRIDGCTLSAFQAPRIGPWRRLSSRCPGRTGRSELRPTEDWFSVERYR